MNSFLRPVLLAAGVLALAGAVARAADSATPVPPAATPSPVEACSCHDAVAPRTGAPVIDLRGWATDGVHRKQGCAACHPGIVKGPHAKGLARKNCADCHTKEDSDWLQTVHGRAAGKDKRLDGCMTCHTEHAAFGKDDVRARYVNTGLLRSCAACHEPMPVGSPVTLRTKAAPADRPWPSSLHGLVVDIDRTSVANCGSCHGVHHIFPSTDPRSDISSARLGETCGACHEGVRPAMIHGSFRANADGFGAWVTDYFDVWYLWTAGTVVLSILGVISLAGLGVVLRRRKLPISRA